MRGKKVQSIEVDRLSNPKQISIFIVFFVPRKENVENNFGRLHAIPI